jgi:ABC-type Mn2+/Zn2+ transport system ATPase subunit
VRSGALIELCGVELGYGSRAVVRGVDLAVHSGTLLGLVGPNGAGKTTILRALLGLLRPRSGTVRRASGLRLGYVPQRQVIDPIFPLTVRDIVTMGRYREVGALRRLRPEDHEAVDRAIRQVGVTRLAERAYRELSGGQKQRVVLARALAAEPDVLVLDEPTNDMDVRGESEVMALLHRLRRERGTAVLMVSHLLNVVANHVDELAIVTGDGRRGDGELGEGGGSR